MTHSTNVVLIQYTSVIFELIHFYPTQKEIFVVLDVASQEA